MGKEVKKAEIITVKDDENEFELLVKYPNPTQIAEAQMHGLKTLNELMAAGAMPKERIMDYMIENGFWTDEHEEKLKEIDEKIEKNIRQINRGAVDENGKKVSKEFVKKIAIDTRILRIERSRLNAKKSELEDYSIQSQTDDSKMDYLVSVCTFLPEDVDEDGNPIRYFKDFDDYTQRKNEVATVKAQTAFLRLFYGLDANFQKELPENKFLIKYGFAREDDLRLVNEDGHLVDTKGKLIDEEGRYIEYDEEGDSYFVDENGEEVDENGNPIEEFVEFDE